MLVDITTSGRVDLHVAGSRVKYNVSSRLQNTCGFAIDEQLRGGEPARYELLQSILQNVRTDTQVDEDPAGKEANVRLPEGFD